MRPFPWKNSKLRWIVAAGVVLLLSAGTFRHLVLSWPIQVIFRDTISIPEGASAYGVARLLKERGLIQNENIFVNAVRLKFGTRSIRAGDFLLLNVRHIGDLAGQILRPRLKEVYLTLPEGLTRHQVAKFIEVKYPIDVDRFIALTEDQELIQSLGLDVATLEGYLYPDSYRIHNGSTEADILRLMVAKIKLVLNDDIFRQGQAVGLSPNEILTMASIIEGEARHDSERVIISAVYHNRLERGMYLQADPTVQYALPGEARRLLYRDYEYPSEYNTYLHRGLPPGPVNNPGEASIQAAVAPADVDYLYFVADGRGGHIFTYTLDEHNQIVQELREKD
ncbi:MAG: endolytic transglycosylase MltG [Fidelibacterota bacterium]|nr:MAG: endolytic transglycosylase MltG [Candidatus Neomarinimicrobiota bacterium]